MLEHLWAVPPRNAVASAGGFRISDGFISPLDLIAIGLVSQQEASELHALENKPSTPHKRQAARRGGGRGCSDLVGSREGPRGVPRDVWAGAAASGRLTRRTPPPIRGASLPCGRTRGTSASAGSPPGQS
jgi:hypothetical protein